MSTTAAIIYSILQAFSVLMMGIGAYQTYMWFKNQEVGSAARSLAIFCAFMLALFMFLYKVSL